MIKDERNTYAYNLDSIDKWIMSDVKYDSTSKPLYSYDEIISIIDHQNALLENIIEPIDIIRFRTL